MTPAKPLPLLVPVTSISLAGGEGVDGQLLADRVLAGTAVRISTRCRRGVVPAEAKCPALGLVTLRPSISPNPTWMAL